MMTSIRLASWLLVLALMSTGCASTGSLDTAAPARAQLEVINRSDTEMWVAVRGRVEATVQPASRAIVRQLQTGEASVRVTATPEARASGATRDVDLTLERRLVFLAGERQVLDLFAPGAAGPLPPPLGDLAVRNTLSHDLEVWVDGVSRGPVLAGTERVLLDLTSGKRRLKAADRNGRSARSADVTIGPNTRESWLLKAPAAELRIINDTIETVLLSADDRHLGRLAPGARLTFKDLGLGTHLLVAIGERSKHRYQKVLELTADFPAVWGISSGSATLIVVNETGEDVTAVPTGNLVSSSARTLTIPAGAQYRVDDVVPSLVGINAVTATTHTLHKMEAELRPGQIFRWVMTPAASGVRVVNRTAEDLSLYVGGDRRRTLRGGQSLVLTELPRGAVTLEAYTAHRHRYTIALPPAPREARTWTIRPATGAVRVFNQRPESLSVYIDARRVGAVAGTSSVTFSGVAVGRRLVEVVGQKTGVTLRTRAGVTRAGTAEVRFRDPRAMVTIVNRTGERLRTTGLLASQRPLLGQGAQAHFDVAAGKKVQLALLGQTSGLTYRRAVEVARDSKLEWVVNTPTGAIVISNSLDETIAVSMGGAPRGKVAPGQRLVVGPLPATRVRLVAQGLKSKRIWLADRQLQPNKELFWSLIDVPARMMVKNRSQEPLRVLIGGRPYGLVPADGYVVFGNLAPGRRAVEVVGMRSRVSQEFQVPLEAGRTDVVVVHAPFGTIMVDNLSGEDLVIRVGDKPVGRLKAGREPTPVPVPAGIRLVQVERVTSGSVSTYRLQVRSQRSIHLEILALSARAAIKNLTDKPLTVFADDKRLGVVAPGESLMVDDLSVGSTRFRAIDGKGGITHVERRALSDGELFGWTLR